MEVNFRKRASCALAPHRVRRMRRDTMAYRKDCPAVGHAPLAQCAIAVPSDSLTWKGIRRVQEAQYTSHSVGTCLSRCPRVKAINNG